MRIAVLGLGYVGVVSAACLARNGHTVVGVDPVDAKVNDLNAGRSPLTEPGLAALIEDACEAGRLSATKDLSVALLGAELAWICVGTPSASDGSLDTTYVQNVIDEILEWLETQPGADLLIVLRSTVLPGTTRDLLMSKLQHLQPGGGTVNLVFHPEFLREASAIEDFDSPPRIVVGEDVPGAGDALLDLYQDTDAPVFRVTTGEAEMVKYCDNTFHATKVTFANEMARIAQSSGVDARRVSEVFLADKVLNISEAYLRPGFAYGGSCLPKDTRALVRHAGLRSVRVPLVDSLASSNRYHIEHVAARVLATRPAVVGMVGIAFKRGTDDLRESPLVDLVKILIGEGCRPLIYDPGVNLSQLHGSNREAVERALAHLGDYMVDATSDLEPADVLVVGHKTIEWKEVDGWLQAEKRVIDLVDIPGNYECPGYEGLAWP